MPRILKLVFTAFLCAAPLGPCLAAHSSTGVTAVSASFINTQRGRVAGRARARSARRKAADAEAARRRRAETLRVVWQTVKDEHFDPTFGGVDWDAVRLRFAPLAAHATSDAALHRLLQEMLNELKQSHFQIVPPESIPRFDARRWGAERADGVGPEETPGGPEEEEEVGNE